MASSLPLVLPLLLLPPLALLSSPHALSIWRATRGATATLPFPPTALSATDIAFLFLLIALKSALAAAGVVVPTLRASASGKQTFDLPELCISAPLKISAENWEAYHRAVKLPAAAASLPSPARGLSSPGRIPYPAAAETHAPLLPAALSTPLMLFLLTSRECPIRPFGAVNVRNRFDFVLPAACRDLRAVQNLHAQARMGGQADAGRRTKRGIEFDVSLEVSGFWCGVRQPVFRQIVTILQTLPRRTRPAFAGREDTSATQGRKEKLAEIGYLRFAASAPSTWAKVCCDYNPIHMSKLAAKVLGFPGRIAHGNHAVAAVMDLFSNELLVERLGGAEVKELFERKEPWWMEVAFRRPIALPMKVEVRGGKTPGRYGAVVFWEVSRAGKVYVEGRMGTIP